MATITLRPNGVGQAAGMNITIGGSIHWQLVDEVVADDDDAVGSNATGYVYDLYNLTAPGSESGLITEVRVYWRGWKITAPPPPNTPVYCKPRLWLDSSNTYGTEIDLYHGGAVNYNESLARPGGGTWVMADLPDLQAGIGINSQSPLEGWVSHLYVVVTFSNHRVWIVN